MQWRNVKLKLKNFFSGNEMEKCKVVIENLFFGENESGKCKVDIEIFFSGND